MGPYCRFCNNRCFCHMPEGTPPEALKAYGTSTIIATCPGGQAYEKQHVGWCYRDILTYIAAAQDNRPGYNSMGAHDQSHDDSDQAPDYPDGLPTFYAVFQVAGDRDHEWYAGWLEVGAAFEPYAFHTLPIDEAPRAYVTQEEARRACWDDDNDYDDGKQWISGEGQPR